MILQEGLENQISNIIHMLAQKHGDEMNKIDSLKSLKNYYNSYTSDLHKVNFSNQSIQLTTNTERSKKLLDIFNGNITSNLDDRNQKNVIKKQGGNKDLIKKHNLINNAIIEIESISQENFILLNLIINEIFIFPAIGARGGSSSTGLGLIWADPKIESSISDIIEFLIHEFTHNCMFIDERRYGHYFYEEIIKEDSWAKSAILNVNRPLDKVLHSIIVSLEIILFRDKFIGHPNKPKLHPPTQIMVKQIQESIISVENTVKTYHSPLVTNRVFEILNNVKKIVSDYV